MPRYDEGTNAFGNALGNSLVQAQQPAPLTASEWNQVSQYENSYEPGTDVLTPYETAYENNAPPIGDALESAAAPQFGTSSEVQANTDAAVQTAIGSDAAAANESPEWSWNYLQATTHVGTTYNPPPPGNYVGVTGYDDSGNPILLSNAVVPNGEGPIVGNGVTDLLPGVAAAFEGVSIPNIPVPDLTGSGPLLVLSADGTSTSDTNLPTASSQAAAGEVPISSPAPFGSPGGFWGQVGNWLSGFAPTLDQPTPMGNPNPWMGISNTYNASVQPRAPLVAARNFVVNNSALIQQYGGDPLGVGTIGRAFGTYVMPTSYGGAILTVAPFAAPVREAGVVLDAAESTGVDSASVWTRAEVNGSRVYQRSDLIDPSTVDKLGRTNLARMQQGIAPLGPDGLPMNLHHMLQTQDGPLAEMTQTFHQNYSSIIHINDNSIPSGINRGAFDTWRSNYWSTRASDFGP